MRVYELAKAAGVTSAEVLRAAEGCGAEVTNAIIGTIAEHQEVTASDYKKVHDALIDAVLN